MYVHVIYTISGELNMQACAACGCAVGAAAVQTAGAQLSGAAWQRVRQQVDGILAADRAATCLPSPQRGEISGVSPALEQTLATAGAVYA